MPVVVLVLIVLAVGAAAPVALPPVVPAVPLEPPSEGIWFGLDLVNGFSLLSGGLTHVFQAMLSRGPLPKRREWIGGIGLAAFSGFVTVAVARSFWPELRYDAYYSIAAVAGYLGPEAAYRVIVRVIARQTGLELRKENADADPER